MWSNQGSNRYHGFGIARDQGMPNADVYICRESSMAFGSTTAKALPNFNQTNVRLKTLCKTIHKRVFNPPKDFSFSTIVVLMNIKLFETALDDVLLLVIRK